MKYVKTKDGKIYEFDRETICKTAIWVKMKRKNTYKEIDKKDIVAEAGCTITSFARFNLGEGIEKKQEDFAAEVAKQIG